ncbi:sodium- and chloride-dependent GABA transporter 1-like isoform X2 [Contarinia nasturtii]|uniref:sodium- and chloride-dependent GABA transporter 1-like isoform X2 n=1 Tax=Contarinia nasturtii TaxID=265458 RepID=UPI0012D4337E|nr:sodium- and chloride-dependent GABA transporter 1-like isoform X2 [Contarinia nasturtii]
MQIFVFDHLYLLGVYLTNSINTGHNMQTTITTTATTKDLLKTNDDDTSHNGWKNPIEFLFACMSYAIGLGNVWRFPYLVYQNGGGAFLLPYILMVFVIGMPIFFSELFVGQYSGLGPNQAYEYLAPLFHGLGYCTLIVITFVTVYYMVIISWIVFYFVASFSPNLGWGYCDHEFNTDGCYSSLEDHKCNKNGTEFDQIFYRKKCTDIAKICGEAQETLTGINASYCFNTKNLEYVPIRKVIKRVLASEEYYYENVLGIGDAKWDSFGYPRWQLVLCLAFGWIVAFLCLSKGIKSAGKTVFFMVLFPYVILTALMIRSITLEGSWDGILYYIQPDWGKILDGSVWGDAASQVFYSFGLGCNSLITFASYSNFKNNLHTDTIVVSFMNVFTAVFCGFAVFAMLGFMANNLDVSVADVVQNGPGLAFIAYPEAVLLMPLQHLWAILFFFMMFVLGMGSQFGGIEALCLAIVEKWPHLADHYWRVTAGVCIACFLAGIPMTCNGGIYLFKLLEWHTASWAILLLGIAEIVVLSWVYGIDRTFDNLSHMNIRLSGWVRAYWWSMLMFVTPIASFIVFIFTVLTMGQTEFNGYMFPQWADALGWMVGLSTLLPFFSFIGYYLLKGRSLSSLVQTSPLWKPQANAGPIEDPPAQTVSKSNNWKCFSPVAIVKRRLGCQSKV